MSDHHDENPMEGRDLDVLQELGYEPTDTTAESPIGKFTLWFFGFIFVMAGAAFVFQTGFDRVPGFKFNQERPVRRVMPPEGTPLLQSNTTAQKDMVDLKKENWDKMHKTELQRGGSSAVIPVDKAIEIVAQRGLPTASNAKSMEELSK